ncbi:D-aminoacyl-tRNA deacylase [Ekhidna sp.]|uniref:D-aminoacyl-tRNA deacylase n=1 Tax=Ekhidna sp. TaxID=2608089 RepID=UPI003B5B6111
MRTVIQRVSEASVAIEGQTKSKIGVGLMILLGIEDVDEKEDIEWLCRKISNMRIFPDDEGVMNKSLIDVNGEALVVSQFTLHASTKKGNRPSYIQAAKPDKAIPMYESFVEELQTHLTTDIKTGEFGADMQVSLINDGPVTILVDTKNKE